MSGGERLLFVSPRFLFPADEGGKIRTGQILRGMKGGRFELDLIAPAREEEAQAHADQLAAHSDRFERWEPPERGPSWKWTRLRHLASGLPVSVRSDDRAAAHAAVRAGLAREPRVAVFDYVHAAVLRPDSVRCATVLFTHNVETEIYRRHAQVAHGLARRVWANQARKMERFERAALGRFDLVVAVSQRDADAFRRDFSCEHVRVIPTGVDLEFLAYAPPEANDRVVFCGAMDWPANVDGITWMLEKVWPRVLASRPAASLTVVGRHPPDALLAQARNFGGGVRFTGWVDDLRDHVRGAAAYAIPLRVGGGTRMKGYEAIALGSPVVSTAVGVEGLGLQAGRHYLEADGAEPFADALVALLADPVRGAQLSRAARDYVEEHFSFHRAAEAFEAICAEAIELQRAP